MDLNIRFSEVRELRTYQQGAPNYALIQIVRGDLWAARVVSYRVQEWAIYPDLVNTREKFEQYIAFEEKINSVLM